MRTTLWTLCLLFAQLAWATDESLIEHGRRIFEQGILPDGSPLTALGAGESLLTGQSAACVTCHRRSGMGSREGELPVSPITGPILYNKPHHLRAVRKGRTPRAIAPLRQYARAAYDDTHLARAIRTGQDSSGQTLKALMPRYSLSDTAMQALLAYLRQLSATPAPGTEPRSLQLASIVTPDVSPERRQILLETLDAWTKRGSLSGMTFSLEFWQLTGEASTWPAQLQGFYQRKPVFAVLSGLGAGTWQPVAEFCEQQRLPCLFPVIDAAPETKSTYYSLYLSAGVPQEARLLASHLRNHPMSAKHLLQAFADPAGAAGARVLSADLSSPAEGPRFETIGDFSGHSVDLSRDDLLVAWLRTSAAQKLLTETSADAGPGQIIFSARLAPPESLTVPEALRERVRWVSTRIDPVKLHANSVVVLQPWLQHLGLTVQDESLQGELYAATYFFNDALARMHGLWNREYLLETLESGMYFRPPGRLFYSLSLGPEQRVAAKAGHIQGFLPPDYQLIGALSPRLAP